ncbi:hypothetical protein HDU86_001828 [Geranomyces michiganensis]|nr:hypothetical protein HDU86_001828 [Geranomyces michiganensis]
MLAQEDINADPTAFGLPANARIYLDMRDLRDVTGSYSGAAMLAALNAYYEGAIGILGTDGSESSKAVAQIMGRLQIPQCSPWAGDDALSNKRTYPYFFRTLSGASDDISFLLPVLKYFGWTQFSFIYCDSALGQAYETALSDLLINDARWQVTSKFTNGVWINSDSTGIAIAVDQMTRAFADGTRVLLLAGNMDWMATMIFFAHKAGLMREDMVWVTTQDVQPQLEALTSDTALTLKILSGSFFGSTGYAKTPASLQFFKRLPELDPTLYPDLPLKDVSNQE